MPRPRLQAVPSVAVEVLRFFVVFAGAGLGYALATQISVDPAQSVIGIEPAWLGAILGGMLGYSLGGVIARATMKAIRRTDTALDRLTPEEAVAGGIGAIGGGFLAALVSLPALFLPLSIGLPVFGFLLVTGILLGFRLGQHRREAILRRASGVATRDATEHFSAVRLIDTSVAIDGRILEIVKSGFLQGRYLLLQPVLDELQGLADAGDNLRRAKGRRGLDVLDQLRRLPEVRVDVIPDEAASTSEVDAKLVQSALKRKCALLTFDTGLAKAAALAGVHVQNLHQLAISLRPPVQVGDTFEVGLSKAGSERQQAVGYLDDGTMVVVEEARERIGSDASVTATSVLVTSNGRMVFARLAQERPGAE